jgi:hypothetical protein
MAEPAMLSPNAQSLPYLDSVLEKLHPQEMENAGAAGFQNAWPASAKELAQQFRAFRFQNDLFAHEQGDQLIQDQPEIRILFFFSSCC